MDIILLHQLAYFYQNNKNAKLEPWIRIKMFIMKPTLKWPTMEIQI